MHPAASVIFFTVASGAGYGLLAAAGIAAATDIFATYPTLGGVSLTLALMLVTAGLLSSTFHLGHPERAWRAVSQWRSSWLSREAVAALVTYVPAGALWLCLVGGVREGSIVALLGLLSAVGAAATVFATGKIYAVLKPIREWHTPWTVPVYLAFAASTGLLLWLSLWVVFGPRGGGLQLVAAGLAALALAAATKHAWFVHLAGAAFVVTRESALGLAGRGTARVLDPPHTGSNFLLEEMGFRIGRKHAARLTRLMWLVGFAAPALLLLLTPAWPPFALAAALSALAGAALERWLFFATATHTVMLYYR
jgi:DMSO reductase anchor subunit